MEITEYGRIFPESGGPTLSCHASTVCSLPGGRYLAAWFGGTRESADDVEIWASVYGDGRWSVPIRMSETTDEACWNPVLYRSKNDVTLFFKRGRRIARWKTFVRRSADGGRTFDPEKELVPGDASGGRGPVKDKPVRLSGGVLIAGASHESEDGKVWRAFFDLSRDGGRTWARTPYLETAGPVRLIQPTVWEDGDGVHALLRSDAGAVYRADSPDGQAWTVAYPTGLPNNNSGIDCAALPDGRIVVACNPVGENGGPRTPLTLLVSADGGRSWEHALDLASGKGEYSYPAVIVSGSELFITYTWNRRSVAYARVRF